MMVDPDDLERWVSAPRFRIYRDAAGGDRQRARDLYLSDVRIAGALMEDFHYLEVLLRNRVDETLTGRTTIALDWIRDGSLLSARALSLVEESERRVRESGRAVTRDRILAGLTFGFWTALFDHRYEPLWVSDLHRIVRPDGPRLRRDMARVLSDLRLLRNRAAHHDPLLRVPLDDRNEQLLTLVAWLDPAAGAFLARQSRVADLLRDRP